MSAPLRALFSGQLFRRLLATRAVSQLGDGLFQIATASVLLFENPGPNPVVDLLAVSAVTLIPFSVLGPFAGVFIDRWDRRAILTVVPLVRAAAALAIVLTREGSIAFFALVLIVLSANRFFLATVSSELPLSVPPDALLTANAVQTTGGSITNVIGQGLGALVAGAIGGIRATLIAAAAFAAATLAARAIPTHRGHETGPSAPFREDVARVVRETIEGARTVWANAAVRRALTAITLVQIGVGSMIGVMIHTFITVLGLGVEGSFAILAVLAIGIGIGVVLVPVIARRIPPDVLIGLSFAGAALATASAAISLTYGAMIVTAGMVGFSYALVKIPVDTIVQEQISDDTRGRAFALYDVVFNVARVIGIASAAIAFQVNIDAHAIVVATAAAFSGAGVWLHVWGRALRRRPGAGTPVPSS